MERLFVVKDDNRILVLNSDEIFIRDGKPYICVRGIGGYDGDRPLINVEYKEIEEIQIFESDDGSYVISKKV